MQTADTPAKAWLRALQTSERLFAGPDVALASVVESIAARWPEAPALLSDAHCLSYGELAGRARRYTRWALAQDVPRGSTVALLAGNGPDYVAAWLGLSRAGLAVALLNTQLAVPGLVHGLQAADACALIADLSFEAAATEAAAACPGLDLWILDRRPRGGDDLERSLAACSDASFSPGELSCLGADEVALLIFTSGTTGLPKAARVSHRRVLSWSGWFAGLMGASPEDRLYDCLPMYHSVGGVVAVGAMLVAGGSVVVRERFSVSGFWPDVVRWRCTIFQYIGELCRLLSAAPICADAARHHLRLACGNGLTADVWTNFQARFAVPRILEFYAATEGSFSLFNAEGEPGAIGRIPAFLAHRFPAQLVRFDPTTGSLLRGPGGLCISVERGEIGEAVGRVANPDDGATAAGVGRFEGYTRAADSEGKLARDVLVAGDAWFRTGDLMRQDARGFFYFVDRVGDTFRWKGENVSTAEVERVLCAVRAVNEVVVYGVAVPGHEGRAGMAAMVVETGFDVADVDAAAAAALPSYARPIFLRIASHIPRTETFKAKKTALASQGFDPSAIADTLFFEDRHGGYRRLDAAAHAAIVGGVLRI